MDGQSNGVDMLYILKRFIYMGGVFLLASCALFNKNSETTKAPRVKEVPVTVENHTIHPGFVKKVVFKDRDIFANSILVCDETQVGIEKVAGVYQAFISANYYIEKDSFNCFLKKKVEENTYLSYHILNFKVVPYEYPSNRLSVPKKHIDLSEEDTKRWLQEKEELERVYSEAILDRSLFTRPFVRPLKSKVTSVYGTKRVFNDKKESWHSGVDFRARRPTPIPVANDGKVVFTGNLFFNGNTVIIDHGLGILTLYCHLSSISAEVGQSVKQGTIIGKSGNTGRSSGPHLHWGVRVNGNWIDGLSLIDETTPLNKTLSSSK